MRFSRALTFVSVLVYVVACTPFGTAEDPPSADGDVYGARDDATSDARTNAGADGGAAAASDGSGGPRTPRGGGPSVPCPYDDVLMCPGYCCVKGGQPFCTADEASCGGSAIECTREWDCATGVCCLETKPGGKSVAHCKDSCAPKELVMCDPVDDLKNHGCPARSMCSSTGMSELGLITGFAVCRSP